MSRVTINDNAPKFRELEIRAQDKRWFWIGWIIIATAIFLLGSRELPPLKPMSLPFWMLWAIGFAICELKGWMGMVWSRNGNENLRIFPDHLRYETRGGTVFDRKQITLALGPKEIPRLEILTFGLGGNIAQNRIHLKARARSLYLGRDLSEEEARNVQEIINEWLSPSSRSSLLTAIK